MKKLLLAMMVILTISISSVFAGGQSEETQAKEDENIVLEWWTWDADLKEKNQEIIAAYEEKHPNVTINNTIVSTKEYWTKIRILANQNKLPDVFTMSSSTLEEWAENGLVLELDSYIDSDNTREIFYPKLLDAVKDVSATDHYYALPFALVTTTLFYNKDAFDEAGLEYPNDDWTWDDFRSAAKKLTVDKDNDGTIDQYGYWFYGRYAHVEPWVYANGGSLLNHDTMRFEPDAAALEALEMLTDLVLVDKSAPTQKDMSSVRQQDVFPLEMAAMWTDGSWNINNNRLVADPSLNWGIAKIPTGPSTDNPITYAWADSYSIAPNTKHPQEAWEFTKYVAGEGLSLDMYLVGKIPSFKALTESDAFADPNQKPAEMYILKEQADSEMTTSFTKGWSEWRGYGAAESLGLNGLIDGVINGEMSLDEALTKGTNSINTVLARYYK
ncbi:MAG: sugar ABC transporter substrate-binding protein [Sphaerochaetaceae bacterium]|nr:sugar ABC transporter substrate-binding protein [Sphaerochaetaceae bacterium]MDC7237893.1 sugar ABC transporter substrate-binding protein [Sphaerochaetaceae bacterium]MDC7250097.1 sugar ABC transporter substrate-binding protein [Sphaerochaetaceae bacterium]